MLKRYYIPILTVLLVLFIDQFIKVYIKLNYPMGQIGQLSSWCILHFTENPGMAFGFEFGGEWGKVALSLFRIVACIGGMWYIGYITRQKEHPGFIFSISLILAGALGNIMDSIFYGVLFSESDDFNIARFMPEEGGYAPVLYGRVVDMFYFPIYNGTFPSWFPVWGGEPFQFFRPIFNFADAAISVGVGLIILFQKRFFKKEEPMPVAPVQQNTESPSGTVNPNLEQGL